MDEDEAGLLFSIGIREQEKIQKTVPCTLVSNPCFLAKGESIYRRVVVEEFES